MNWENKYAYQVAHVLRHMLTRNRRANGNPDYYGVDIRHVSGDGRSFDLILTFKSGTRYCCWEWGCHLLLCGTPKLFWKRLHEGMAELGLALRGPLRIRRLACVIEAGAYMDCFGEYVEPYGYGYTVREFNEQKTR
jgi:hypothetical protein